MRQEVDLSHLDPNLQERMYSLIIEFWSVFDSKGIFVPVKFTNVSLTQATLGL